jgi:Copper amine oxidase, enzyme domain
MDYVFQQNGMIRIMVGATGLDIVKGVTVTSMDDPAAAADTAYGTLIAPNLVAPNHDHFFNYRLDFDVDGTENSFVRTGLVPAEGPKDLPRRSWWVTKDEMPMTEMQGRFRVDPMHPAMYHVMNYGKDSGLGHHPGYMILPENSVAYSPLAFANDPPAKRNAFVEYTFWNTPYDANERYAWRRIRLPRLGRVGGLGQAEPADPRHRHRHLVHDGLPPCAAHGGLAGDADLVEGHHLDAVQFLHPQSIYDHPKSATVRNSASAKFSFGPSLNKSRLRKPQICASQPSFTRKRSNSLALVALPRPPKSPADHTVPQIGKSPPPGPSGH